mgnify:FL=1
MQQDHTTNPSGMGITLQRMAAAWSLLLQWCICIGHFSRKTFGADPCLSPLPSPWQTSGAAPKPAPLRPPPTYLPTHLVLCGCLAQYARKKVWCCTHSWPLPSSLPPSPRRTVAPVHLPTPFLPSWPLPSSPPLLTQVAPNALPPSLSPPAPPPPCPLLPPVLSWHPAHLHTHLVLCCCL